MEKNVKHIYSLFKVTVVKNKAAHNILSRLFYDSLYLFNF